MVRIVARANLAGHFHLVASVMGIAAVFIDGGYLDKVLQYDHDGARIDYARLADAMCEPDELRRAYYYHCLPYRSNPPTPEEESRYAKKHGFTAALSHLPRFEVRLGKLVYRGNDNRGNPIFQQKQVDCMVGVDMALLAAKGRIDAAAVFTGDSDLVPAIQAVKKEGVLVTLWHGNRNSLQTRPSGELYELADERRELGPDIVSRLLRP